MVHFPEKHEGYLFIWAATNLLLLFTVYVDFDMKHGIIPHVLMYQQGHFTVIESGDVANAKMLQNVKWYRPLACHCNLT